MRGARTSSAGVNRVRVGAKVRVGVRVGVSVRVGNGSRVGVGVRVREDRGGMGAAGGGNARYKTGLRI